MLSFISSVLGSCFPSLNKTQLQSLSKGIACVALGLRTSHLIDFTYVNLNLAYKITSQLRKHPLCRSLVIIQFKENFSFIGHRHRLKEHLKSVDNLTFIAVHGKEPVKLQSAPSQLKDWLEAIEDFLSSNQSMWLAESVPTCMVSIIGWALEYPIIYTTHHESDKPSDQLDEWEERTNCLGGRPLQLCQLWLADHMLLSYSYPVTEEIDNCQDLDLVEKVNQRLSCLDVDWLPDRCVLKQERVKLDRFAL